MTGKIRLKSGNSLAEISVAGAEILRWEALDRSLLWKADPAFWTETAPILFPVVGWTRNGEARAGGKCYPLGLHGFARHKRFRVSRLASDSVRLVLDSDAQTLTLYPFAFRFAVEYRLDGPALHVTLDVTNSGSGPMPYACGLHPGFSWPLDESAQEEHRIVFDEQEVPGVPVITQNGLFAKEHRPVALSGVELDLKPELFAREALCFLDVKSSGLTYESAGGAALRADMVNFSHIALWSRPDAPFVAIEFWTGHGDPESFDGDLFQKPSMLTLLPGATASHAVRFTFSEAAAESG